MVNAYSNWGQPKEFYFTKIFDIAKNKIIIMIKKKREQNKIKKKHEIYISFIIFESILKCLISNRLFNSHLKKKFNKINRRNLFFSHFPESCRKNNSWEKKRKMIKFSFTIWCNFLFIHIFFASLFLYFSRSSFFYFKIFRAFHFLFIFFFFYSSSCFIICNMSCTCPRRNPLLYFLPWNSPENRPQNPAIHATDRASCLLEIYQKGYHQHI